MVLDVRDSIEIGREQTMQDRRDETGRIETAERSVAIGRRHPCFRVDGVRTSDRDHDVTSGDDIQRRIADPYRVIDGHAGHTDPEVLRRIEHGGPFIRFAGRIRKSVRNSQTRLDGIECFDVCAIDP